MEPSEKSLFELQVDHQSTSYLSETAKWAKFLSILGFVLCGLMLLVGIFAGSLMSTMMRAYSGEFGSGASFGGLFMFIYVAIALLYFFPCLYLFRFAVRMQVALRNNDQEQLNNSFGNLKSCFKFVGILMIIILSFYALALIFGIIAAAFSR